MEKNFKKYYTHGVFNGLITLLFVGSMLQTVLLESGYSENTVNIYTSIMQIVQILTIIIFSKQADKLADVKSTYAKSYILQIPIVIFTVLFCFLKGHNILLVLFIIASLGFNIALGIHNILSYKMPYRIMPISLYGKAASLSGMFGGAASLLVSFILLFLQKKFSFFSVMSITYIISFILPLLCSKTINSLEEKEFEGNHTNSQSGKKLNYFKYKPFSLLILPNLARGFCLGIITMAVTIGYYTKHIDSSSASYLIIITNAINISSPLVYSYISGKIPERIILLISSISVFIFMPLMLLGNNTVIFLTFYGIAYFFVNMINYAVPVSVVKIADYEIMGQYSAGRMLLNTLGTSIAGFACIPMFKLFGPLISIGISAALQLFSGLSYYLYMKKNSI